MKKLFLTVKDKFLDGLPHGLPLKVLLEKKDIFSLKK